ncbi:regulatory YrvL family protein [Lentibacillus sp. L22]|uniref:regulatory YrvL family protein n=1 Tax=Lentibacillus TaxID=175304 RepID=UPI0022B11BFF|nr:regulatory YrvL family protein [Lentibacillus daqui]
MTEVNNDDSFENMNVKEKAATIIGLTLFIILVIAFVLGIFFFGFAGVFELLGIHYQSIWSLFIFVVSFFILGFVVDLFFDAIRKLSVQNTSGNMKAFFIQVLVAFVANWIVIVTVDAFMKSITLSLGTKTIVALLLAILEPIFDNKKEQRKKDT